MAATSTTNLTNTYAATYTTATAGAAVDSASLNYNPNWTAGTGANQLDLAASASGTLSASTTTYTMSAFPGPAGNVAFARVREFYIKNTGAASLTIGPGGTNPMVTAFANTVTVRPGGIALLVAPDATGFAVASGSADKIAVTSAGSTTFSLVVKGASV